jgi:hypothetical protein
MRRIVPRKIYPAFSAAMLLVWLAASCTFSPAAPTPTPVVQTLQVTSLVTREVTQEVTRVVEVPVTVTPTETPLYTFTPSLSPTNTETSTLTPTPAPPVVTLLEYTDCLYGPADFYLYKLSIPAGGQMEAIGRNGDGSWIYVQAVQGWNPCWIQAAQARFETGDVESLPFVLPALPFSTQYRAPDPTARRRGNEVTISWTAIGMGLDDYRGYLIQAWVCQDGTLVFLPVHYQPLLIANTGLLSVTVTDEAGCSSPSSGYIYSAETRGYSARAHIPWPPAPARPTDTATPTATHTIPPTGTSTPTTDRSSRDSTSPTSTR